MGFAGPNCSTECNGGAYNPCFYNGVCQPDGRCKCFEGFRRSDCSCGTLIHYGEILSVSHTLFYSEWGPCEVHTCVCRYTYVHAFTYLSCINIMHAISYIHAYVHTHIHIHVHTYIHHVLRMPRRGQQHMLRQGGV